MFKLMWKDGKAGHELDEWELEAQEKDENYELSVEQTSLSAVLGT